MSSASRSFSPFFVALALVCVVLLCGCASDRKRDYLHHLSISIEPAPLNSSVVAAFDDDRASFAAVAAVNNTTIER